MTNFDINNLPLKRDFRISDDIIIKNIKESYIREYKIWINASIKEHYIEVDTYVKSNFIDPIIVNKITQLFIELGFDKNDIEMCEYSDTHQIYFRIKIYE